MMSKESLVSVIIPCYNHARFLDKAIISVLEQSYSMTEIIVVDDGSSEDIKSITDNYSSVIYIRQNNQGLPAARNRGIRHSSGDYLVFLDADDWLYPQALEKNIGQFKKKPEAAFVSGAFKYFYEETNTYIIADKRISKDCYKDLLQNNHIAMIATVLFKKWVFNEFLFDESLKNCEDYDIYLKITRKYQVHFHKEIVAVYRKHTSNISANSFEMLKGALRVLKRQKKFIDTFSEYLAYSKGKFFWKMYYGKLIILESVTLTTEKKRYNYLDFLKRYPVTFILLSVKITQKSTIKTVIKTHFKKYIPSFMLRSLNRLGLYKMFIPGVHKVKKGDFERLKPFSTLYGYDRGGPVDRYYIENFLKKNKYVINGNVLEIKDSTYTKQFGTDRVTNSDILDIDQKNADATIIGDLQNLPQVQDNVYNCIILTQTLYLIFDVEKALKTCYRILKPGGSLLVTVPGIVPVGHDNDFEHWYWSFTEQSVNRLLKKSFPKSDAVIESYGNVFAATAFLYGMGLCELTPQQLEYHDKHYPVSICAFVTKVKS